MFAQDKESRGFFFPFLNYRENDIKTAEKIHRERFISGTIWISSRRYPNHRRIYDQERLINNSPPSFAALLERDSKRALAAI